jgi:hypothetical protein
VILHLFWSFSEWWSKSGSGVKATLTSPISIFSKDILRRKRQCSERKFKEQVEVMQFFTSSSGLTLANMQLKLQKTINSQTLILMKLQKREGGLGRPWVN